MLSQIRPILTNFDIDDKKPLGSFSERHKMQQQVDWFRVITELRGRGYSLATLSVAIDVPRSSINNWTNGITPNYTDGLALIDLWTDVMSKPPLCDRFKRIR